MLPLPRPPLLRVTLLPRSRLTTHPLPPTSTYLPVRPFALRQPLTESTLPITRTLSRTTTAQSASSSEQHGTDDHHGDHGGHSESHYDPPGGWLWGQEPGTEYKKEGWENPFFYGYCGTLAMLVVFVAYKPDTSYVPLVFLPFGLLSLERIAGPFHAFLQRPDVHFPKTTPP